MGYRLVADVILVVHFAFLVYVVFGGFLAWRWPRTLWIHLVAAAWGLLVITFPVTCPLTWATNWARVRAGQSRLAGGFIDTYITGVLYPARYVQVARALAIALVLISWIGLYLRWRRRRSRTGIDHPAGGAPAGHPASPPVP